MKHLNHTVAIISAIGSLLPLQSFAQLQTEAHIQRGEPAATVNRILDKCYLRQGQSLLTKDENGTIWELRDARWNTEDERVTETDNLNGLEKSVALVIQCSHYRFKESRSPNYTPWVAAKLDGDEFEAARALGLPAYFTLEKRTDAAQWAVHTKNVLVDELAALGGVRPQMPVKLTKPSQEECKDGVVSFDIGRSTIPEDEKCISCKGSGREPLHPTDNCYTCNGAGRVDPATRDMCRACNGRKTLESGSKCYVCNGTGQIRRVSGGNVPSTSGQTTEPKSNDHQFNANGYCKRCGWERDYVTREKRPCIK